jgi:Peptidase M50B-like
VITTALRQHHLQHHLNQIGMLQDPLPAAVVLLIGLAAGATALLPGMWAGSKYLYTIAHEGSHAFMAALVGLPITSVTMKFNGSGLTLSEGQQGLGVFLFQFFGYLGPSALGVGTAKLIELHHIVTVLWVILLGLAIIFLVSRGFAMLCVICTGFLLFLVAWYAPLGMQIAVAYGISWFLLISGAVIAIRHWQAEEGDGKLLKSWIPLPQILWSLLWLIGCGTALLFGATLLV